MAGFSQRRTYPPVLVPGDRVGVVAPSGPLDPDRLARGVALLRSWGLDVVVGAHALDRSGHLAGADRDRAADLFGLWCDPLVRAVLCARGGTGAGRLLDLLDWTAMAQAGPRLLVGSSDVTALHEAVALHLGLATVFGPVVAGELLAGADRPEPATAAGLRQVLLEQGRSLVVTADPPQVLVPGRVEGITAGGTLALLCASTGTPEGQGYDGCLLLLEDVGEAPYRIDRMLTQLLRSGRLAGVRGFVLGSWEGCGEVLPVLADRLGGLGVPVVGGFALGHGPVQLSIPLGVPAVLDSAHGTLTCAPTAGR